jgi:aldose 1-epimerase
MFITIKNKFKTEVTLSTFGASIYDIKTLDKNNVLSSITLEPKNEEDFKYSTSYFGKTIGRTGGRIKDSKFILNNQEYVIESNDPNGLHGGNKGFSYQEFDVQQDEDNVSFNVKFHYFSPSLEMGYPGDLSLDVTYRLYKDENKLEINYLANSTKDTLCNLSNHTYFNLNVNSKNNILDHYLYINSSKMLDIVNAVPTNIINTPLIYSFKNKHKIKDYLFDESIICNTRGYDNPYIFDNNNDDKIILEDELSGRRLIINTSYPSVVIYTCNYIEDFIMNNNRKEEQFDAVAIECMFIPNSINNPKINIKKDILKKNQQYNETITYNFDVIK